MSGQSEAAVEERTGRPMRADARRNYDLLVVAARKVFAQHGGGASMEAIAKEAGVGVGTLYRHFPKRIDIVEAVYRDDVDVAGRRRPNGDMTELEPWAALETWLHAYMDYGRSKHTFLNELHEAFEKNPDLKPASRERGLGRVREGAASCPRRRRGPTRHRRGRPDAVGLTDVHEQHARRRAGRAVAGHGARRPAPSPGLTPSPGLRRAVVPARPYPSWTLRSASRSPASICTSLSFEMKSCTRFSRRTRMMGLNTS